MISGVDYKAHTRARFFIYAVCLGPLSGSVFMLLIIAVCERKLEALFPPLDVFAVLISFSYFLGILPAFATAWFIGYCFERYNGVTFKHVVLSIIFGFLIGNLLVRYLILHYRQSFNIEDILLFEWRLLELGLLSTLLLWYLRPRQWIGPLTREELVFWRDKQEAN